MSYTKCDRNQTPLVSAIVPVYNVERYLSECVNSIRNQTYRELEIILIDDGSTDRSGEICDDFRKADTRICVIHKENEGLGLTRDAGIDAAHGEWICFVDSDDIIHSEYVETLLRMSLDNKCLSSHCGYQRFSDEVVKLQASGKDDLRIYKMDYRQYFLYMFRYPERGHNPFAVPCNIYHKSLFEEVRFGQLRFAEDSAFTPRIIYAAKEGKIAVTDKVLYHYRQRQGSLLHSKVSLSRIDRYHAKMTAMDLWKKHGEKEMYALFFPDFFYCMVIDYIDLAANLPDESAKYAFLKDEIVKYCKEESSFFSSNTILHPWAKILWNSLFKQGENGVILYGFGYHGKDIYPWIKFFGIRILEVWDKGFDEEYLEDNVCFRKPHIKADKNIPILILIENRFVALDVQSTLREWGYQNFWLFQAVQDAITYKKYNNFLPELIENCRRLSI